MKRLISSICVLGLMSLITTNIFAQDTEEQPAAEQNQADNRPVRGWFDAAQLIDMQTPVTPAKGSLELLIQHRFGNIKENKQDDLFGLYGSSNIRMGFNYGITDRLMVAVGTEKDRKIQDISAKYSVLQQTRSGSMPFALSVYTDVALDARGKEFFGPEVNYKYIHRMSYFTQLIVARKINEVLSLEAAPSFMYFNAVDRKYNNYNVGLSVGGKVKFAPTMGITFEYDQAYLEGKTDEAFTPQPNFAIGFEKGTATHAFQVFAASYRSILNQYNMAMNEAEFFEGGISLGFNITVRF